MGSCVAPSIDSAASCGRGAGSAAGVRWRRLGAGGPVARGSGGAGVPWRGSGVVAPARIAKSHEDGGLAPSFLAFWREFCPYARKRLNPPANPCVLVVGNRRRAPCAAGGEVVARYAGESLTGSVFNWLMNPDSTIIGLPAGSMCG